LKKLRRDDRGNPGQASRGNSAGGLVPGRGPGGSEGHADPALGTARQPSPGGSGSPVQVDLPVRGRLPRCRSCRRPASSEAILLAELSQAPGAHAAVLIDGAGYHGAADLTIPDNITLVRLPPYSPELNAIEKLWQVMRENILSHRLFDSLDHVIDACCKAGNRILAEPGRIRSTCGYEWASQVKT
jgi:predicted Zn-ribbon and HTH transcriptional regulator